MPGPERRLLRCGGAGAEQEEKGQPWRRISHGGFILSSHRVTTLVLPRSFTVQLAFWPRVMENASDLIDWPILGPARKCSPATESPRPLGSEKARVSPPGTAPRKYSTVSRSSEISQLRSDPLVTERITSATTTRARRAGSASAPQAATPSSTVRRNRRTSMLPFPEIVLNFGRS